ncbi:MAG: GNAT family N-acetyltransferase [Planctomycetota bacterium]|nr:MAG: GNAT family N-acetyltransferase [Planctomycetota bacterium]
MNASFLVRRGRESDAEQIALFQEQMALLTEGKRLDPTTVRRGVSRVLSEPGLGFYLMAEEQGEIVGCLLLTTEWSDWRGGLFYWIQSVYVAEARRRRGIYRSLHQEVRRIALGAGNVIGIRLYVEKENQAAMASYRAMGMEKTAYRLYEESL